jgi:type II secretory pathway pseudopilin PulG
MNYRGEISSINRRTLNIIKSRLQLDEADAQAIEHEILEPMQLQFTKNLQEYELAFSDVIQKNENLSDLEQEDLGQLRQVLGLSDVDTRAIETKVKAQLQVYRQHLQDYEEVFRQALRLEYPLNDSKRVELQQVQQRLALKEADIEPIETKVITEMEDYYRHLDKYKQLFIEATKQEYPLGDTKRRELLQQQENLDLSDLDISTVESEITVEIESYQQKVKQYQQKLNQYQQAFLNATQAKYLPTSEIRKQLRQTWQTLGLTEADVITIESPIIAQINLYQQNLDQYEKKFDHAVQQQYPLSEVKRNKLARLKLTLSLSDDDVTVIEAPIKAAIEEHLHKLQQYEEAFLEAIKDEFPLAEETRRDLTRFQQVLEISNEDVANIEEQIMAKLEEAPILDMPDLITEKSSDETLTKQVDLSINREEDYQQKSNKYTQESSTAKLLWPDDYKQNYLKKLQHELELQEEDIASIISENPQPSVPVQSRIENPSNITDEKTLLSDKKLLLGLVSFFGTIVASVVLANLSGQVTKARESEAKQEVWATNRAQQAFYTEYSKFAPDFKTLGSTPASSKYYNFSIPKPSIVIAVPIRTTDNIKSYIGGVSVNPTTFSFSTVICRQTGNEPLTMKSITGSGVVKEGEVACGPNTEKVK